MTSRWVYANLRGIGDVCFRCSGPVDVVVEASRMCRIGMEHAPGRVRVGVARLDGYALGLVTDPVSIPRASMVMYARAPAELAAACDAAWRTVQIAPAGIMGRLDGDGRH